MQYCRNAGLEPEVAFESEQAETIQYLVASNLGITLLPEMVLRHPAGEYFDGSNSGPDTAPHGGGHVETGTISLHQRATIPAVCRNGS